MEGSHNLSGRFCHFCLPLFISLLVIVVDSRTNAAVKTFQHASKTTTSKRQLSGSYCGVYCLYSIMKLSNREVKFTDLVKPEYIGSRIGSSFAELKQAAEDNRLYAAPVGKLTSRELRQCHYPVILHVKSSFESLGYDHYVLFLGTENGLAKIFDPPNPVRLVHFNELSPRWDGKGLIVSSKPIDFASVVVPARRRFIVYSMVVIAFVLALHFTKRFVPGVLFDSRIKLMGLSITQAGALGIAALIIGMLYHFGNDEGLLANANATAAIQEAHAGNFIPKISEREVHKLLGNHTVFIDARLARDYKAGHLDGAISVPVDANDIERRQIIANIAKDEHIVLYCQSAVCKYAEIVALKLIEDGYSDVSIYKGGWADWAAKNGKIKQEQS